MIYVCTVCGYEYDDSKENVKFGDLPADWACPVCGVDKKLFKEKYEPQASEKAASQASEAAAEEPTCAPTASDICVETMSNWGVKWVLGMVGHSNLGMGDAVRRSVENGKMRYVGMRHEGAAAFACSAYGKIIGKPAACLTIAGPGTTNLLTGLCDAKLDSAPVIALNGQLTTSALGLKVFQDLNLFDALSAAAISQQEMHAGSKFGKMMSKVCADAIYGRGVAQLVMPDDVQVLEADPNDKAESPVENVVESTAIFSDSQIESAVEIIAAAKNPVILIGRGSKGAAHYVEELAEILHCPIMTTYPAKGMIGDSHPLCCGVQGLSGTGVSAKFMARADCVIAFGVGFSRHTSVPIGKCVVQIDSDRAVIGRRYPVEAAIIGKVADVAPALSDMLKKSFNSVNARAEIAEAWNQWRGEKKNLAQKSAKRAIAPALIAEALSKYVPDDAIVSVDVGNVAYSVGKFFEAKEQTFICSWYLGSIGFGVPGAIGAWCATQEPNGGFSGRPVVAIVGDGGFGQYLAEWTTIVKNGMNIKCVVYNNSELAKITREQKLAHMQVWETELLSASFAEYSKLCGGVGIVADNPETLDEKVAEFFKSDGPAILEIISCG